MNNFTIIHEGKLAVQIQALKSFWKVSDDIIKMLLSNPGSFTFRTNRQYKFIYVESIPPGVVEQYGLSSVKDFAPKDTLLKKGKPREIEFIKLVLDSSYDNYLNRTLSSSDYTEHYLRYVGEGNTPEGAKKLAEAFGLVKIMVHLCRAYHEKDVYLAITELTAEHRESGKYETALKLKSERTFYNDLRRARDETIDDLFIHGLSGRTSNRPATCPKTKELVVLLASHVNQWSANTVMVYANSIIMAMPSTYNNGRLISRENVQGIRHEKKNLVNIGIYGDEFIRTKMTNYIHVIPTAHPLDVVEIDFTKVHASVRESDEESVSMICKIRDKCTDFTLGMSEGTGESFKVFQTALREMLYKTGYKIPAEFVVDLSPAVRSGEFKKVKEFLEGLLGKKRVRFARSPEGKGQLESHWKTLFEVYMPRHVGSLGGNIATSRRHQVKREVRVILQKIEYMRDPIEWKKIIRDIDREHCNSPRRGETETRFEKFHRLPPVHAVKLDIIDVARLGWYLTISTFENFEFKVEYEGKSYFWGWTSTEVKNDKTKLAFATENTGKQFDLRFNPDNMERAFVYEKDGTKFLMELPCVRWFYGNKVDHDEIQGSRKSIIEEVSARKIVRNKLKNEDGLGALQERVEKILGKKLVEKIKELDSGEDIDTIESFIVAHRGNTVSEIDPFGSRNLPLMPMKRSGSTKAFKPKPAKYRKQ